MGAESEGRINKMAEGVMRLADSEIIQKASNITYQSSNITRMGENIGIYSIGETGVNRLAGTVHKDAEVDG